MFIAVPMCLSIPILSFTSLKWLKITNLNNIDNATGTGADCPDLARCRLPVKSRMLMGFPI